jgi:hypothetical protein
MSKLRQFTPLLIALLTLTWRVPGKTGLRKRRRSETDLNENAQTSVHTMTILGGTPISIRSNIRS